MTGSQLPWKYQTRSGLTWLNLVVALSTTRAMVALTAGRTTPLAYWLTADSEFARERADSLGLDPLRGSLIQVIRCWTLLP